MGSFQRLVTMKQKFSVIAVLILAFAGLLGYSAQAQENREDPTEEIKELNATHPELNLEEDKTLISEPDQKVNGQHPAVLKEAPASTLKSSKTKADGVKPVAEKEGDDALSFNFLYYIIQKFKISDIVGN